MKNLKLDTHEKIASGFKIPDTYFDNFSEKVMRKFPTKEPKVITFYARNKRWIYSAAAVLVISLTIPIAYKMQNKEEEISTNEVENYLVHHTNLSDDDVVNLLNQEDIDKLKKINAPLEKEMIEDVLSKNTELEQYITNEN
jgi:hypothetical protein